MALTRKSVVADTFGTIASPDDSPTSNETSSASGVDAEGSTQLPNESAKEAKPENAIKDEPKDSIEPDQDAPIGSGSTKSTTASANKREDSKPKPPESVGSGSKSRQRKHTDSDRFRTAKAWAREAVDASRLSAKREAKQWTTASVRLPVATKQRLEERRIRDWEGRREAIAIIHYVNAALKSLSTVEHAERLVDTYVTQLGIETPPTVGTTTRLHESVAQKVADLGVKLRAKKGHGFIGYMQAAAVERLLDALDRADENENIPDLDAL